jgi:Domain of unknown function (DUF4386)
MFSSNRSHDRRAPMDSIRKTALVGGILYLITFASSIPAALLLGPVLSDPAYITSTGADTQVLLGAFLDVVNALACIGTAVALYSVVKRQHEGFALGFVSTRMFEAAVIVIGVISIAALVSLRQAGAAGSEAASLVVAGQSLLAVRDWTFQLGPNLMAGMNAILLGTLMYRSRLVPRAIPTLGLIGAPLLIVSTIGIWFGVNDQVSAWHGISVAPIFLWELSLGLWMTFKGFNRSSPVLVDGAHPTTGQGRLVTPSDVVATPA